MVWEPRPRRGHGLDPSNPYQGRWRGWYPAIADWQLEHPGGKLTDCAKELGKHVNTITMIVNTDMYRDYFARRREEWTRNHDFSIINKTTHVAERALDVMLDKLEKQADKLPMNLVTEVATSALDRLGYAPKPPASVEVNVNTDNRKVVMVPISAGALEEARDAIRAAEQARRIASRVLEAEPSVQPTDEVQSSTDEDNLSVLDPDHRS
jgi:hypothetical protein